MLFRYRTIPPPSFSLRLDGSSGSLVLFNCNASRKPSTSVEKSRGFYAGALELAMDCTVKYLSDQLSLETVLEPYLNVAISFVISDENTPLQERKQIEYDTQVAKVFFFYFYSKWT